MRRAEFKHSGEPVAVRAELTGDSLRAEFDDGSSLEGPFLRTGDGAGLWRVGDRRRRVVAAEHKGTVWVAVDGRVFRFERADDDDAVGGAAAENMVAAPMPGKVIKVMAQVGDTVSEGQAVLIVEAMKMEHTLRAPTDGEIVEMKCAEGQQVEANVPLVEIQAAE